MTEQDWNLIKNFTKDEPWGDWTKMDRRIFFYLDAMREKAGHPIIIHCGYEASGHATKSQHYLGKAVDLHIKNMPLLEQWILAERFPWTGIGLYTDWSNPGLHLDVRDLTDYEQGARWSRRYLDGSAKYVALDKDFIQHVISGGY